MKRWTVAQKLYLRLGVDPILLELGPRRARMPHNTKKGPGRYHRQEKPKRDTP